jgi:hypothetical protein
VAKLDPNGGCLWTKPAGGPGTQYGSGVAVDGQGNVLVTGGFQQSIDFGCSGLNSNGGTDLFVAKLDPGGNCLWSKRAGGANDQWGWAVAADGAGNALVAGHFSGSIDFGCGLLDSTGANDVVVAKLGPDGSCIWSRRAGDALSQVAHGIAASPAGNPIVAAEFDGTIDFGCGPHSCTEVGGAGGAGGAWCNEVIVAELKR